MKNQYKKNGHEALQNPDPAAKVLLANDAFYFFKTFLNHASSLCGIIDEKGTLLFANKALHDYLNPGATFQNQNLLSHLPQGFSQWLFNGIRQPLQRGTKREGTIKTSNANGIETVFSICSFPMQSTTEDHLLGWIATDITAACEVDKKLTECNEKWLAFTRQAYLGIWEWDLTSTGIWYNETLHQLIGEQTGLNTIEDWIRLMHTDDQPKLRNCITEVLMGICETWDEEYRLTTGTGKLKTVLERGVVISKEGQPVKLIGFVLDVSDMKDLESQLISERRQQEQELARSMFDVQESERQHIGRELHDNVAQYLVSAKLFLEMPSHDVDGEIFRKKSHELIEKALNEITMLSRSLVVPALHANGLETAINDLVEDMEMSTSLHISFINEAAGLEHLDECKKIALMRIVQEQFKNIIKHAKATKVCLSIRQESGLVEMEIKDNGIGFNTGKVRSGVGLSSIFQRTKACNGNVKIESGHGKGTRLLVVFPCEEIF